MALFTLTIILSAVVFLLFAQIVDFSSEWHLLKTKLIQSADKISIYLSKRFDLNYNQQSDFFKSMIESSGNQALPLLKSTASSFTGIFFYLIMIPLLTALILFHRGLLINTLYSLFDEDKRIIIHEILTESMHAYYNFIKGMLLVYLIVGILNSIGLYFIGVPHPVLFGFVASVLTFIPYVGIIIASLLPITISWVTYNSVWYPVAVIIVFAVVQLLEAYIIFPFAVGSRLKINSLVIILMILFGGLIWGAAGMILFIPMVSILKLIADRTESLKTISLILGSGVDKKIDTNLIISDIL